MLGIIADALGGARVTMKAPIAGVVIGHTRHPLVHRATPCSTWPTSTPRPRARPPASPGATEPQPLGGRPAAGGGCPGSSAGARVADRLGHDPAVTPAAPPRPAVDALVDATPASRDRVVDLLRAVSICVVVLWHWALSVTHWHDGRLTMPNPVADVPGLWAATWVLQVMPVFFLVGGYANLAGWQATTRDGGGRGPLRRGPGSRRLAAPLVPWLGCWLAFDLAVRAAGGRERAGLGDWSCSCRCGSWRCTPAWSPRRR